MSTSGKIQGAQIRLDRPFDDRKYMWLSGTEKLKGTGAGSPVHFVGSLNVNTVCVTEGGLKGTIAHCLTGWTFACLAGAGQYVNFINYIPCLKSNGVHEVVMAYDMDLYFNEQVKAHCLKILCAVRDAGLRARVLTWDPVNKGVDDHYWAKELKTRLPCKLENEFRNHTFTVSGDTACKNFCSGIRQNGISSKILAFLYFKELPFWYLLRKTAELPDASFMELMAVVEKDIPKDF